MNENPGASSSLLQLQGVAKIFAETGSQIELFRDLDFTIQPGDFISIMGASGVGKSTLLHMLGLLDRPSLGRVFWRGEDVTQLTDRRLSQIRNREIGFVFQFHHLLPDLTVLENALLPLRIAGNTDTKAEDRVKSLLDRMGLAQRLKHLPAELSGGERQRTALARALANSPKVLLCDEPSGNLDAVNALALQDLLTELNRDTDLAMVIVTHDEGLAGRARRRLKLHAGKFENRGE